MALAAFVNAGARRELLDVLGDVVSGLRDEPEPTP